MPRNYSTAEFVYVLLTFGTKTIKYGFRCRLQRDSAYTALGITKIDPTTVTSILQGLVIGCNAPKPPRAKKKFDTSPPGHESTFCGNSSAVLKTARDDGWKISPGRPSRKAISTPNSKTLYVTVNGLSYAWNASIPATGVLDLTSLDADIGAKIATIADEGLVWGCDFPKPPRAGRVVKDPDDGEDDWFTTFADPARIDSLATGWQQVNQKGTGLWTATDLMAFL
jgi:hypothetical protein